MAGRRAPERDAFEEIVRTTAYRPAGRDALLADLHGQLDYQPDRGGEGLDELADALLSPDRLPALHATARAHPRQPLCHLYLHAAAREAGDADVASTALAALQAADPDDPMGQLLALAAAGRAIPGISEERRLANLAKFAATPLLANPYRMAVDSIFDAIRDREEARVMDVGVGGGAQMAALLDLLASSPNRVRRIEIVGLDFMDDFLDAAARTLRARAADRGVQLAYLPVRARIEALDGVAEQRIVQGGPLDAVNATIALHEVPGEAKLAALAAIRRLAPRRFVLAEWNFCLENTLAPGSVEFLFNARRFLAAMVAALREQRPLGEARAVARDWMSMAGGQVTCPARQRQECFLDAATWRALLDRTGFTVARSEPTSHHRHSAPIVLLEAQPR